MVGVVTFLLVALTAAGCGQDEVEGDWPFGEPSPSGDAPTPAAYTSELQAPAPSEFSDNSDVLPDADDGIAELDLDSGVRVVLWIDPDDIRRVLVQHSDPDDPEAWTEPEEIYTAGDGCLIMDAATNGEIVAVGLGCYEDDAFIQQAPDQGAALVSTDLTSWEVRDDLGEFYSEPAFDGDDVVFVNGVYEEQVLTWTADDGFRYDG
ncbi:hypothetical protein GCM10009710_09280 [Aeromicrobium alkaliterrae]|uniref:Uncharacterized protein n=2 Tax=Aeromicrobium alkaliterrae TaxID=302168 RepID=A0ABN2JKR8_9ACTN